jgi:hypothetical protein
LRRGWTKFSLYASAALGLALVPAAFSAGARAQQTDTSARANELMLAGLRPGRDSLPAALKRFKAKYASPGDSSSAGKRSWGDACTGRSLEIETDNHSLIQRVTLSSLVPQDGKCVDRRIDALDMKDWATGRGLRLGDPRNRVTELYGEPNTSGPSIKGSKELEFLRYGFDWAGADVPQAMEIYCERDTGRVLEITLSDPLSDSTAR